MFHLSYAKLNDYEVWSIEKVSLTFTMLDNWESETNTKFDLFVQTRTSSLFDFYKVGKLKKLKA